ncbi:PKD domain-containing protein [Serinibacter arcticus]|uniref:PKD domain-containing protein n=2 Tax=Serinibacter arcticus TaxID=1655435 RepID=A0A2U1ZWF5_9MICO|nr:PKD domain-containing protein [Serinibacter arcticus]
MSFAAMASATAVPLPSPEPEIVVEEEDFSVLVFSKTAGFRHDSIPAGIAAIEKLGEENNFAVDTTEDSTQFTDENLANYDAVIWLSTTGDVLNAEQQEAFETYIGNGGGYAGVHAASDTEYDWPWYGELVGAYFAGHPQNQTATIKVEDHAHDSTAHLDDEWVRYDEWYNFRSNPRDTVHVLASLDETTYQAGASAMGIDHPIAWCHTFDGGRSWYTGGGHTIESFEEPDFVRHLLGGIQTAAGAVESDCTATQSSSFERVDLSDSTSNPMALKVADDGTVFYIERDGRVQRIDADTTVTTTVLDLSVTQSNEDGLLGITLDPNFSDNGWVYLYWSPTDLGGSGPHNRISRFTYDAVAQTIDPASGVTLLEVATQRDTCCHAGGDMLFDDEGNLILATGDNTNPFESGGFSPIDERAGRSSYDAQGTSANSNDLRGKLIRITPQDDGTYTVPEGNMFAPGTELTRPEIYAMGLRNPFRIGIDHTSGNLLVADYGPDSSQASPTRGPIGTVEWNIVAEPGFYGWPHCTGDNAGYNDYNFATGQSGEPFDCTGGVVNDSPNNTGLTELPPAIPAEIYYNAGGSPTTPEIGGGGAPMAGDTYVYDPELVSDVKWPAYWDGKAMFGEWNKGTMYSIQLAREDRTDIVDVNRVLPGIFDPSVGFNRPMDFEFGPDGALYVIDWGSGFGGNNPSSGIFKVNYVLGEVSPIARATADVTSGLAPLEVSFSSDGTRHPNGEAITLQWTFGDGSEPSTEANPVHVYEEEGSYVAQLTATDAEGRTGVANVTIVVGNIAPTITITFPENGGFFDFGDQVAYEVVVEDPDGTVDCADVTLFTALGHDSHAHPFEELSGCSGMIQTARDEGHGISENIFWVIEASYIDDGGSVGVPLRADDLQVLQPKTLQAEFFTSTGRLDSSDAAGDPGVVIEPTTDVAGGGSNIGYIEAGDWWAFDPISLAQIDTIALRAASPDGGGTVSLRWNDPEGPELASIDVPATGDWQSYVTTSGAPVEVPEGTGTLYFVSLDGGLNVNWAEFNGRGVTDNVRPDVALTIDDATPTAPATVTATATASDPDGEDSELTYEWDAGLGDGFADGGPEFTFTYEQAGTYRLQVRVTDPGGAFAVEYLTVTVVSESSPPPICLTGRSDDFLGDELDDDRWTTVVRRDQNIRVADGSLVIPASKTDIYGPGGDVSNIVLQELPDGDVVLTTEVSIAAREQYQQAGLIIYGDDDNYAKLVIQGRTASPDAGARIVQLAVEENGTAQEVNTSGLGVDFPDTVQLRLALTDGILTGSYSADGQSWTELPDTLELGEVSELGELKVGLTAFANTSSVSPVIDASFGWFQISPDDTATTPGPDDLFDGDALDACRWSVVREDTDRYRVTDGWLELDTTPTDIYGTDNGEVPNIVVQAQPAQDWTVETIVDVTALDQQYQQGGLILYGDDDNYVKLDVVARNAVGSARDLGLELRSEAGGVVLNPQPGVDGLEGDVFHLRLTKEGDTFTGAFSANGETWTPLAEAVTNTGLAEARVGLFALGAAAEPIVPVRFDHFLVVDDEEVPVEQAFVDVPPGTKFFTEISWLASERISTGWVLPDGTAEFRPVTPVARDAMAAFLYRLAGEPDFQLPEVSPFVDVPTSNQFYTEIAWLSSAGISTGWDNGDGTASFRPLEPIARDAMAAFLYRYSDVEGYPVPEVSAFDDVPTTNQFFTEISWLAENGIATGWIGEGNDGTDIFRPLNPVNRDAMAAFMYRLEHMG